MIGVIARGNQRKFVEEFFELFKTPWEFFQEKKLYDVVITTGSSFPATAAQVVLCFTSEKRACEPSVNCKSSSQGHPTWIECGQRQLPIYGDLSVFRSADRTIGRIMDTHEPIGYVASTGNSNIIRIGYDIFTEIQYLLTQGQPRECAHVPTLDLHIAMLRNWILDFGIRLIEIPPRPYGYNYTVCLTHDVDFLAIRDHMFDHSLAGFLLRIFSPLFQRDMNQRVPWSRLFKNIKTLLTLPLVYLGLKKDTWFDLDRYSEIEQGIRSTFFLIPFKNLAGMTKSGAAPKYRAAKYDLNDNKKHIEDLIEKGHEVGLHGIDAWHNLGKAVVEKCVIEDLSNHRHLGVRMHWLYFDENSPGILEEAGFLYDSTYGYNDTVGYLAGTSQVFLLPGASDTYELPLHVMDTSLFSGKRGKLKDSVAFEKCKNLSMCNEEQGGVLTINWHTRSLNPERNWDDFYLYLLDSLRSNNVWFAGGRQAVEWFKLRRSVQFESVEFSTDGVKVALSCKKLDAGEDKLDLPKLLIRCYKPTSSSSDTFGVHSRHAYHDIPWSGEPQIEIPTTNH